MRMEQAPDSNFYLKKILFCTVLLPGIKAMICRDKYDQESVWQELNEIKVTRFLVCNQLEIRVKKTRGGGGASILIDISF